MMKSQLTNKGGGNNIFNKYKIYVHVAPNKKLYIGQTKLNLYERWGHNGSGYKGQLFYKAIRKYGWENIQHILLIDNLSHAEADIVEMKLISKYNTTNVDFGYNVLPGGSSSSSPRKIYQYSLDGMFIRKYDNVEEAENILNITAQNIRSSICLNDDKHIFTTRSAGGYLWSYKKMSNIKPYKDIRKNRIYRYDLNGNYIDSFNSTIEASDKLINVTATSIYSCLNGATQSGSGFIWSKYKLEKIKPYRAEKTKSSKRIPVFQYDLNGKYISTFSYVNEASNKYSVNPESIRSCCVGKNISSCGYMWSYEKQSHIESYKARIQKKI